MRTKSIRLSLLMAAFYLFSACAQKNGGDGNNINRTIPEENLTGEQDTPEDEAANDDASDNTDALPDEEQPPTACACPEGYLPLGGMDGCTKTLSQLPTDLGTTYQVCDAQDNSVYGKFGAQYPDGTKTQDDYWGDDDGQADGRLNEVGIWACNGTTGQAGSQPSGEWIGFSYCLELSTKADYIVGIAGDNQVRLKLNGETVFEVMGNVTKTFNYWWLYPLNVSSGLNIIEMEGYNFSGPASFGAEISGPFAPGTLINDQAMIDVDYSSNIVFSTELAIGGPFDVGENSGLTCPETYSLNRCTQEPVCTFIDTVPCTNIEPETETENTTEDADGE
jgi:hypothetical protein